MCIPLSCIKDLTVYSLIYDGEYVWFFNIKIVSSKAKYYIVFVLLFFYFFLFCAFVCVRARAGVRVSADQSLDHLAEEKQLVCQLRTQVGVH